MYFKFFFIFTCISSRLVARACTRSFSLPFSIVSSWKAGPRSTIWLCVCVYTWLEKPDAQNREKTNFMIKFNCRNKLLYLFIISTFSISVIWCVSRLQFRAWCLRERTKIQKCFFQCFFVVALAIIAWHWCRSPLWALGIAFFLVSFIVFFFPPRSSSLLLLLFCHLN